ncbi:SCP2 sterol-binding domain-containing protein [Salinicola avicenniae]|uniref:SCP2 sterol-binding domain-containing protein n=1 Tax=Salinicola avicenniae TaxID=2916836 RepID=UPI002073ED89|nr:MULTISPECIES: SCP2 sterol-binding domain-containing protein [unclassified Salinicola]
MDEDRLITKLQDRFDPAAAGQLTAVYQFDLDDTENYHVQIDQGELDIHQGQHDKPDVVIASNSATLIALFKKELNAMQALLSGRIKVKGDIGLASRLPKLFGKPRE